MSRYPQWVNEHTSGRGIYTIKGHHLMLGEEAVGYLVYLKVGGKVPRVWSLFWIAGLAITF